jgi:hypothetical protein
MAAQRRDLAIDTAHENRPANTKKTYKKAQGEWVSFCEKYEFEDGDFVNADKWMYIPTASTAADIQLACCKRVC